MLGYLLLFDTFLVHSTSMHTYIHTYIHIRKTSCDLSFLEDGYGVEYHEFVLNCLCLYIDCGSIYIYACGCVYLLGALVTGNRQALCE